MAICLKRVYSAPGRQDGFRVLVDRLWPRGVSKEKAEISLWLKEAAPSDDLRKWVHADPARWQEFRQRYFAELKQNPAVLRPILEHARKGNVTLLFASRNEEQNNAVVLKEYLEAEGSK